ncbi:MAG: ABC transporter substrate-binding protein [Thermofilum sp.]|jgi:peptide/nickel transport system substrate-binding protein|nr:ABC transporter substrate-binding protein [Thermofilum sp.]
MKATKTILVALTLLLLVASFIKAQPQVNPNGWLDQVVFVPVTDRAKAITMLKTGDLDIYFIDIGDPDLFKTIKESPELAYDFSFGLTYELTFNPVGPEFQDGTLNPFSDPRIREAMNYIVDRKYIVDEIMGGLATPKWLPVSKGFPEYERFKDLIQSIENEYQYNFDKGKQIITEEMQKLGAELKDGKWYYKGQPVVIKFLIRTEDRRKLIGDYVADQLEKLGFTVQRMYKTSREASPIWMRSNPALGQWHIYTAGWITTAVSRDDSSNFGFYYTPLGAGGPLWSAYKPSPEFLDVATKLWNTAYKTVEERNELMRKAFQLAIKDSVRVWLVDQNAVWVRRKNVDAVADYAGGYPVPIWPYTLKFTDKTGGTMRVGSSEVLVEPWNPVAPTNWIYDTALMYGTVNNAYVMDPHTGLPIPIKMKSVVLETLKTTPTAQNPDSKNWLTVKFVDKVEVPNDAWYAWDVKAKKFVTAGEAGVKVAQNKVTVDFGDVIGNEYYHDNSTMSLADWIIWFPLYFERADNSSPLYDESWVPNFEAWRSQFIAWRIVSEHPLKIEYYFNATYLDAELIAVWPIGWAAYPWHMYAIGILAESDGKLAFSSDKADAKKVEWMNYIGGESLKVLSDELDKAIASKYIPFKEALGKYVTENDAVERYNNLKSWYNKYGHFWVSNGPYFLAKADTTAHTATLYNTKQLARPVKAAGISTEWVIALVVIAIVALVAVYLYARKKESKKGQQPQQSTQ